MPSSPVQTLNSHSSTRLVFGAPGLSPFGGPFFCVRVTWTQARHTARPPAVTIPFTRLFNDMAMH